MKGIWTAVHLKWVRSTQHSSCSAQTGIYSLVSYGQLQVSPKLGSSQVVLGVLTQQSARITKRCGFCWQLLVFLSSTRTALERPRMSNPPTSCRVVITTTLDVERRENDLTTHEQQSYWPRDAVFCMPRMKIHPLTLCPEDVLNRYMLMRLTDSANRTNIVCQVDAMHVDR